MPSARQTSAIPFDHTLIERGEKVFSHTIFLTAFLKTNGCSIIMNTSISFYKSNDRSL